MTIQLSQQPLAEKTILCPWNCLMKSIDHNVWYNIILDPCVCWNCELIILRRVVEDKVMNLKLLSWSVVLMCIYNSKFGVYGEVVRMGSDEARVTGEGLCFIMQTISFKKLTWQNGLIAIFSSMTGNVNFFGIHKVHWYFLQK